MTKARTSLAVTMVMVFASGLVAQPDINPQIEAAQKQLAAGDVAGAVKVLEALVAKAPESVDARLALGRALDLQGAHEAARVQLEEAVRLAPEERRNSALTALGISYAFESKPDEAARYYQRAFDAAGQAGDREGAAGLANALARIYLESGDLAKAEEWYRTGYETARNIPGLSASQAALWDMRWHHALARIAARRGDAAAVDTHVAAVRAAFGHDLPENQQPAYPYLRGYVAFYLKDYRTAIAELLKGDQSDPFVLGLIGQAHEKLGERAQAGEYYRKVLASTSHSINAAFARQPARKFLR